MSRSEHAYYAHALGSRQRLSLILSISVLLFTPACPSLLVGGAGSMTACACVWDTAYEEYTRVCTREQGFTHNCISQTCF